MIPAPQLIRQAEQSSHPVTSEDGITVERMKYSYEVSFGDITWQNLNRLGAADRIAKIRYENLTAEEKK